MDAPTVEKINKWADDPTMAPDGLRVVVDYADGDPSHKIERYTVEMSRDEITRFRQLWHYLELWDNRWMGHKVLKYPTDMWVYQELMVAEKYDWIIESGTFMGGSGLFFAQMCELIGHGEVITMDIFDHAEGKRPQHPRLAYWDGSSVDPKFVEALKALPGKKLVILDSDHSAGHVYKELEAYGTFADYIIVEDSNINGHPVRSAFGAGPQEAIAEFLSQSPVGAGWLQDRDKEHLMLTANPGGYLKRR